MAQQALADIVAKLKSESLDQSPITDTAERIEELSATELKAFKKTADAVKLIDLVKTWYKRADSGMMAERRQWYKNLDMYQGRQFTEWSRTEGRMIESISPDFEPRLAINVIEPAVRTEMAKTGSKHPTASVSPASNDDDDVMAALAAQSVWDWNYDQTRFQTRIFNPANLFRTVCGNGFLKTFYDPTAIDEAATAAQEIIAKQQATQDQSMAASQNVTDMFPPVQPPSGPVLGKIVSDYVDPFHLFVSDLTELDIQKMDWVIEVYTIPVEKAKAKYADYVPKNWSPETTSAWTIFDLSHLGIKSGKNSAKDEVRIMEAWVKPGVTKLLPDGGLIIIAGEEIVALADEGLPYKHAQFPYAHITGIETGRFYRKSIVESIVNIQNEINRTYAQIIKQKNLNSKPQFYYDEGSVDPKKITSKAGLYIPIRLGMQRPTAVPIQPLAQYVLELLDRLSRAQDDITGQHQVSRGQAPGANSAANAIAALQETDDNFLFTTFDSIEAAIELMARQYLSLVVQYWDAPRVVSVVGRDHAADAKILTGADIQGGTDIRIQGGSTLPTSKAARIATVTDWIKNKIISPQDGLEAMEMGTLGKVFDKIKADEDAAKRENLTIRDLNVVDIQGWKQQQQAMAAEQNMQQTMNAQAEIEFGRIIDPAVGLGGGAPDAGAAQQAPPPPPPIAPAPIPASPIVTAGPNAVTQPGAMAAAPPGQLVGPSQPAPQIPVPPAFFPVNWYDNHAVHMQQHRAHANSQAFLQYPDEIKEVFEDHYWAHYYTNMNIMKYSAEIESATAVQQSAELAQQSPTVRQQARIGGHNQFAGQQFKPQ